MKTIHEYTADELIEELSKRDGGYFIAVVPKEWSVNRIGEENTEKHFDEIQEMFMQHPSIDDIFVEVMDVVVNEVI